MVSMKNKDNVLKIVISALFVVFGLLLLLDQLNLPFIDDLFTPWYTIVILFVASCLLAYAICKKSPIFYILSMFFAGIYLVISIDAKVENLAIGKIIMIIPLFIGLGIILADRICKWSPKAMRFGLVVAVSSATILVSTILNVWKYVIPVVVILIGVSYMMFSLFSIKKEVDVKDDDHYVTYDSNKNGNAENEKVQDSNEVADSNNQEAKKVIVNENPIQEDVDKVN